MMMMKKTLSAIPPIPKDSGPELRRFLLAMKEFVEVRDGQRGDPLEKAVTRRDLVDAKIAEYKATHQGRNTGGGALVPVEVTNDVLRIDMPPRADIAAHGMPTGIVVTVGRPFNRYHGHAYTEVWRADGANANFDNAVPLPHVSGESFWDSIEYPEERSYTYWAIWVNQNGQKGPRSNPVSVTKPATSAFLIDALQGQIGKDQLTDAFRDDYEGLGQTVDSMYVFKVAGPAGSERVVGMGFANTEEERTIRMQTDRFYIVGSDGNGEAPFVVDNGQVFINSLIARRIRVDGGQIGTVSFSDLRKFQVGGGETLFNVFMGGKVKANYIDVDNLRIGNANITGVLQSDGAGRGWKLDKNSGVFEMRSGTGVNRIEIDDQGITVYNNNVPRVRIGRL